MNDELAGSGRTRVRVRKRRSESHKNPLIRWLRARETARTVTLAIAAVTLAWLGAVVWQTRVGALVYNGIVAGMGTADVRYIMGAPKAQEDGGTTWVYDNGGGAETRLAFVDGVTQSVSCNDAALTGSCPGTMGLGMGTTEDRVLDRLGAPARQRYSGGTKVIEYPDLGLSFELKQFRVHRITLQQRESRFGYVAMVPRIAVP